MTAGGTRGEPRRPGTEAAGSAFIQSFVDDGLGNSSYLVGSRQSKVAVLIDPLRDVDPYLAAANRLGVRITHVLDTHLHNDFLSGAREVAARIGVEIGASAEAGLEFEHRPLSDGDRLPLGELEIGVMSTPGHTPEHISFTLDGAGRAPIALFSGGALIVGGAARTDLLGQDVTESLARKLYHTIHDRLLALPDEVVVCPTHGAGSFCAAPASEERTTTIGLERKRNPLCQPQTEDHFVTRALEGLSSFPVYFRELRPINRRGPKVLGGLPAVAPRPPSEIRDWIDRGGTVLDVRPPRDFAHGHIPGAYGIALDAGLTTWAGWLIPFGTPLVLVVKGPDDLEGAVRELIRIGFDNLHGYLEGGLRGWTAAGFPVTRIETISPIALQDRLGSERAPVVIDVRFDDEWADGHIPGAVHIENGKLPLEALNIREDSPIVVHCETRNRSTAGISVLARRGYRNVMLLDGGFSAWKAAGLEVERESGGTS